MKVEDLLDVLARFAWTVLVIAGAGFAATALVRYIVNPPVIPERIEVVIVGQDEEPKPEPDKTIGQKIGAAVVGQGVSE